MAEHGPTASSAPSPAPARESIGVRLARLRQMRGASPPKLWRVSWHDCASFMSESQARRAPPPGLVTTCTPGQGGYSLEYHSEWQDRGLQAVRSFRLALLTCCRLRLCHF
jgi:hypothetical protein